jgi:RND family efflux transporter MFP subunit
MKPTNVILALGLAACGGRETSRVAAPSAEEAAAVRTAAVVRTGGAGEAAVAGAVRARERAVLSARISAAVIQLPYQEGQRVAAGAVVVRLDDAAGRAALAAAQAAARAVESDLDRTRLLVDAGATPRRELERSAAAASAAQAQLAAARDGIAYSTLRAPFAGRLSARRVNLGDVVTPGSPLVEVEGEGGLEVQATVAPEVATSLRPGAKLKALVDGQAVPLAATVTAIAPSGDATTHRVELTADLPDAPGLRAGLFARLLVPAAVGESRLTVPATALFERGGLAGVFVVDAGRARLRWAAVGAREGERVEIRAGVTAGERVVVDPSGLVDGAAAVERRK